VTMLTPLGAGPPRARRWPRVLATLVVLALVAAAGYGIWWWLTQRPEDEPAPAASPTRTCTTPTPPTPKKLPVPGDVTLAVANGTDRSGLAVETADAFAARGFVVTDVGNTDRPVKAGSAEVRYRKADVTSAVVVASYVPGAELVMVERVEDAAVAIWLGPEFTRVASSDDADPKTVALPPGKPVCRKQ
jgi:LytR cell envelope-related transcriptional attenuator